MKEPAYTYKATIDRWVDGDTVYMTVDLGFRVVASTSFRLYGIDTPERGHEGFDEATDRANELAPVDSTVTVETYKDPGKYGRWLANIFVGDVSINDTLIEEKFAVPYFGGKKA